MAKRKPQQYKHLQNALAYQFKRLALLEQALSHRSVGAHNNERLEFLGDALLSAVIAQLLYQKYPQAKEGQLTRLRASLVKGVTLAEIARELNVGEVLLLGDGELKSGGRRRDSILADALEAIIGAVFLDSDMSQCHHFIEQLFAQRMGALSLKDTGKDAKTKLQERLQSRGMALPYYELLSVSGHAHQQTFHIKGHVAVLSETVEAKGHSRRKAEQMVAEQLLLLLKKRKRQ